MKIHDKEIQITLSEIEELQKKLNELTAKSENEIRIGRGPRRGKEPKLTYAQQMRLASFPLSSPNPVFETDDEGNVTYLNPSAIRVLSALELELGDFLPQNHKQIVASCFAAEGASYQERIKVKNRSFIFYYHQVPDWRVAHIYAFDITGMELSAGIDARLSLFPLENPNPVIEAASDGSIIFSNPATRQLLDKLGIKIEDFLPETHSEIVASCLLSGEINRKVERTINGRTYLFSYHPVLPNNATHIYALDITEEKKAEAQIVRNAFYDGLTGLPNRALFIDRLSMAIEHKRRKEDFLFAVLYLDMDRFRGINDSMGHDFGDKALVAASKRIVNMLRPGDTVARIGGDEFAVALDDLREEENAVRLTEMLVRELKKPLRIDEEEIFFEASIGVCLCAEEYERAEDYLRYADIAMNRAKANGGGRFEIYDKRMSKSFRPKLQMETELRRALERNEFTLYYQPIITVDTLRISACEALIRWNHPTRGLVPPGEFIPVAEDTGLIEPIGRWSLYNACMQNRAWRGAGLPDVRVSVNLSTRQFLQKSIADDIVKVMMETDIEPEYLEIEITESAAAADIEFAVATLKQLKEHGLTILMDDFGTGYSTMSYIQRFPIDILKIDRSFIGSVTTDPNAAAIVNSIMEMAKSLNLSSIAEGVETEEQLEFVKNLGCNTVQGFFYSKPLPVDEFTKLLSDKHGYLHLRSE